MSRIIITRHPNGEDQLSVGWDRPMQVGFVDVCDADGEYIGGRGLLSGVPGRLNSVGATEQALQQVVAEFDIDASPSLLARAEALLAEHVTLDYPASNVIVDLTREPVS
jgi:hypothetical protein